MVYIISDGDGFVKIGKTNNLAVRLKELQTGNARKLTVLKTITIDKKRNKNFARAVKDPDIMLERRLHSLFEEYRVKTEWNISSEWFDEKCLNLIKDMSNEEIEDFVLEDSFWKTDVEDGADPQTYDVSYKTKYEKLQKDFDNLQKEYWNLQDKYMDLIRNGGK